MGKPPRYETGSDRYDNPGGRIKAIKTWDDIEHDSEDEFHAGREKILLDTYEDQDYGIADEKFDETELSEEEVFALETGGTSEDDDKGGEFGEDSETSSGEGSNLDATWGSRKKYYYDADEVDDLEEAREEEKEALRLQKKRINQMSEEDFLEHGELSGFKVSDKTRKDEIDGDFRQILLDRNLREHPVINALVELKVTLDKLDKLELSVGSLIKTFIDDLDQTDEVSTNIEVEKMDKGEQEEEPQSLVYDKDEEISQVQPTLVVEEEFVSFKKPSNKRKLESTDFGDLDTLDDVDAEDKAQRRKSLRHYVARIDQKLVKHDRAILQSGDVDVPYKDPNNSKNNKIPGNKEENDADLDDQYLNDDINAAIDIGSEDDFYKAVKNAKKAAKEKTIQSEKSEIIYEDETLPDGAKRQINYQILKNKGLTPRRKKEQRNPRVKHRSKYEKAKKKIKSFKRVFTQLEGSYGGEKTGIKTDLSRSIRFH
ncbi:13614_t:CDS:10 [Acaulospora colombiana]|uniref:13614_t:CDS:1 n=1 Tax=Acaulospora colombiana TaxID=27376 RepID=A0ACA9K401_9GLOM|nr:13614_t:CDS:10 [Acaulospora colombiana]